MTTQELIVSIKSRALVPISQATFTEQDLLGFANEITQTRIVPFLIKFREGYFLNSNETEYVMPQALTLESQGPQIPEALHPILAQAVACQLLESLGFIDKAEAAKRTLAQMENDVVPLLSPRMGRPHKRVINRNPLVRFS
jgi:hypothetical protein